jgi:hypothetical protein
LALEWRVEREHLFERTVIQNNLQHSRRVAVTGSTARFSLWALVWPRLSRRTCCEVTNIFERRCRSPSSSHNSRWSLTFTLFCSCFSSSSLTGFHSHPSSSLWTLTRLSRVLDGFAVSHCDQNDGGDHGVTQTAKFGEKQRSIY